MKKEKSKRGHVQRHSIENKNYITLTKKYKKPISVSKYHKEKDVDVDRLTRARKILGVVIAISILTVGGIIAVALYTDYKAELAVQEQEQYQEAVFMVYDEQSGLENYTDELNLFVINSDNPVDEDFYVETTTVGGVEVDERIANSLEELIAQAQEQGVEIVLEKGIVTYVEQEAEYLAKVDEYVSLGYTTILAKSEAKKDVAYPGESDLESGLVVKISGDSETFADTDVYRFLNNYAADYGFVFRYPVGKELYTGVNGDYTYIRYVGTDNAINMRQLSMCLEEYISYMVAK